MVFRIIPNSSILAPYFKSAHYTDIYRRYSYPQTPFDNASTKPISTLFHLVPFMWWSSINVSFVAVRKFSLGDCFHRFFNSATSPQCWRMRSIVLFVWKSMGTNMGGLFILGYFIPIFGLSCSLVSIYLVVR